MPPVRCIGCAVDTPNHFYSFSFELFHDWTHFFSKREALWQYFERLADKHDLRRHIRYPPGFLSIQARMYATYHMEDPQVFYNKEDLLSIPRREIEVREQELGPALGPRRAN